ncbi:MAG: tyrosine-type recombinase/integrase, partial [Planctomycetes bacterium]|nr:tyrosine-type recombinase/integrase [Planctomycetota bacterium]
MSPIKKATNAAERYDVARYRARISSLPPDYPLPQPTAAWPPENVALLEQYREWLLSGGASPKEVYHLYIPMAGHALGLNLKPHPQLDLDADLERALDYVKAKGSSAEWTDMCRVALVKFRRFLRQERGLAPPLPPPPDLSRQQEGLPQWLIEQLTRYQHLMERNWRPARLDTQIRRFWSGHVRLWRWLVQERGICEFRNLKRQYVLDYIDHRLAAGYAVSGINSDLRNFHAFLLFLQDQDVPVPQALLRVPSLKPPDSLPRFLTDEQVRLLRDEIEAGVARAGTPVQQRDALMERAAFYLLWHGGLRLGELEELKLGDLDLPGRKLMVRKGKGLSDRAVYLTDTVVAAVQAYLPVRGLGPTDHLFLYRNAPVCKDLIRSRLKAAGEWVGVKVYPHRLRHTTATQLLNAGCRVTSIQKFLGHKRLNSTMVYARVHDQTVADDYYSAMERVEQRLQIAPPAEAADEDKNGKPLNDDEREQLLDLIGKLVDPDLSCEVRIELVNQMRHVLNHSAAPDKDEAPEQENGRRQRGSP